VARAIAEVLAIVAVSEIAGAPATVEVLAIAPASEIAAVLAIAVTPAIVVALAMEGARVTGFLIAAEPE